MGLSNQNNGEKESYSAKRKSNNIEQHTQNPI